MTIAATISIVACALEAAIGLLCLGLAGAPGWRQTRLFGVMALLAALYSLTNVPQTLDVAPWLIVAASQVSLMAGALHLAGWIAYTAESPGNTRMGHFDTVAVGVMIGVATLALVPGVLATSTIVTTEVAWLNLRYQTADSTAIGQSTFLLFFAVMLIPTARYVRQIRARVPVAGVHLLGFSVLMVAAVNEMLVASGLVVGPYLLDFGFLAVVLTFGGEMVRQVARESIALQKSEERLCDITFSMADWVWEVDEKGVYTYSSARGPDFIGESGEAVLGKTPFDFMPPEEARRVGALFAELVARKAPIKDLENWNVRKNGERICLLTNGVPILDRAGQLKGYRGVDTDITERKRLQARVVQAERLASMGTMAAGLRHEINNPLAYTLYNVESLAKDIPKLAGAIARCCAVLKERVGHAAFLELAGDAAELLRPAMLEDAADRAREALDGALRIKNVTQTLSTFSRGDRGTLSAVDLSVPIESAVKMAANEIKHRARLTTELGPLPQVWGSEAGLALVFLNLILNAAHAIDEGHAEDNVIKLRTWAEGDHVYAEISDTGVGIPPEHLERIFEPFFTTREVGKGSGLGLSICRNIVTQLGGDIQVTSAVGKGSRFVVRLPVQPRMPAPPPPATSVAAAAVAPGVRGRILVVDDEAAVRKTMERIFSRNHEVVTAASGREGRALLEDDRAFDVILCDLMMPDVTGMELHAWLTKASPALARRTVFMTGGAFTARAEAYLATVSNLRVDKPFDRADLEKLVAETMAATERKRAG